MGDKVLLNDIHTDEYMLIKFALLLYIPLLIGSTLQCFSYLSWSIVAKYTNHRSRNFCCFKFCQSDQNLKILMSEKSAMRTFVLQSEISHMMEKKFGSEVVTMKISQSMIQGWASQPSISGTMCVCLCATAK